MSRIVSWIIISTSLCGLAAGRAAAAGLTEPPEDADSRYEYEQVELRDHTRYPGLIESESGDWITLIRIQSLPGKPTHLVVQPFDRSQISSVARLDADKRAALQRRIEEFRNRATIEAVRMDAVRLEAAEAEGNSYRHYRGKWFSLDSTADEQNTRRVIVRAEQIFAAYRQILPPRCEPARPPRLVVLGSMSQYQALLARLGLKTKISNPACFLEDQNVVAVGSDLNRLAAATCQTAAQNAQMRRDLRDLEARFADRLLAIAETPHASGDLAREQGKFKRQIEKKRDELRLSDQQIDRLFKKSTGQTLVRLYHEAFHAYLRNNVFPRQKYDVPPWLNEGLAVIFEGGLSRATACGSTPPIPSC